MKIARHVHPVSGEQLAKSLYDLAAFRLSDSSYLSLEFGFLDSEKFRGTNVGGPVQLPTRKVSRLETNAIRIGSGGCDCGCYNIFPPQINQNERGPQLGARKIRERKEDRRNPTF